MERLVTTAQAAEILGLSLQGIHYRIKKNQLKSLKKDGKVYVYVDDTQKYNFEESEPIPYKDLKDALSKNSFTRFVYDSIIYDLYSNLSIEVIETNSLIEKYLVK